MATTLSDLLNDVEELTRRPDARARAALAVNSIISDICENARYGEDLIEITIPNPGSLPSATIPLSLLTPVVRAIEYVKPDTCNILSQSTPRNALDSLKNCTAGVYYRSGTNLIVNAPHGWTEIRFGYWRALPRISEASGQNTHWLLDTEYNMMLNGTVARVFSATGDDDSGQIYEQLFRDMRTNFRRIRGQTEDL